MDAEIEKFQAEIEKNDGCAMLTIVAKERADGKIISGVIPSGKVSSGGAAVALLFSACASLEEIALQSGMPRDVFWEVARKSSARTTREVHTTACAQPIVRNVPGGEYFKTEQ